MAARNILETAYRIVTGKRVLITIGMLVVLMITGSVYQMLASSADNRTFPAPGRLVDVGGYRMHIHCTGEAKSGAPTVILDHGGGAFGSLDWSVVQPVLSKSVRVCAYDRPGYGWSDTSPKPRTARSAAEELHTLLANAEIPAPYLMVADSWGGYSTRMFATMYAHEVAGLVFMDISHENTWKHPEIREFNVQYGKLTLAGRITSPVGLWRVLVRAGVLSHPYLQFAVPQARDVASALTSRTSYWKMIYAETNVNNLDIDAEQVRASRRFLGDLPILVLTAGSGYPDDSYRKHWLDDQADLLGLSSRTEQWVVADATHVSLTTDKPEIVQRAVQSILSKIQI